MANAIIRRCPVCQSIRGHTEQVVSELRKQRGIGIEVEDGNNGEFTDEVDGRRINAMDGEALRNPREIAAEVRETPAATAS